MFYSQFILSKKGPLGTIWIAAHLDRNLRKNQIAETDIPASVDCIIFPEVPIALRLSSHLLLGVVRIYSRKVNYLFHDCSEALIKIKQSFHTGSVDLPPEAAMSPFHSITLPETFDFDELVYNNEKLQSMAEIDIDEHMTTRDLITLKDTTEDRGYFGHTFTFDERLAGHDNPYPVLDFNEEDVAFRVKRLRGEQTVDTNLEENNLEEDVLPPLNIDDDFEKLEDIHIVEDSMEVDEHSENRTLSPMAMDIHHMCLDEVISKKPKKKEKLFKKGLSIAVPEVEKLRSIVDVPYDDYNDESFLVGLGGDLDFRKQSKNTVTKPPNFELDTTLVPEATPAMYVPSSFVGRSSEDNLFDNENLASILGVAGTPALQFKGTPLETPGPLFTKQGHRKRKLILDHENTLSSFFMKNQLSNTDDLCHARKKLSSHDYDVWRLQMDASMEPLLFGPSVPGICAELKVLYDRIYFEKMCLPIAKPQELSLNNEMEIERPYPKPTGIPELKSIDHGEAKRNSLSHSEGSTPTCGDRLTNPSYVATSNISSFVNATLGEANYIDRLEEDEDYLLYHIYEEKVKTEGGDQKSHSLLATEKSEGGLVHPDLEGNGKFESTIVIQNDEPLEDLPFLEDVNDAGDGVYAVIEPEISYSQSRNMSSNDSDWSTRTRVVADYLHSFFTKVEGDQKQRNARAPVKLSLSVLLKGRFRKEASRMFFETLVLKTKGYLQVEQSDGISDIYLLPTAFLMKGTLSKSII